MRSVATALLGVTAVLLPSLSVVEGVTACTECTSGVTCILEDTVTSYTGGDASIPIKFCNYDTTSTSYELEFSLKSQPVCDKDTVTLPKAASMTAQDGCTADACTVTVQLENTIDWAIAVNNDNDRNVIYAKLTKGGSDETVAVATAADMSGSVMTGANGSGSISVCARTIPISGSRFSLVKECNVAEVCQGTAADTACTTSLQEGLYVDDVSCTDQTCTGNVVLNDTLPCDGSTSASNALVVAVTLVNTSQSNFIYVGTMTAATAASISNVSGFAVGSSELTLTTDSTCFSDSVTINITSEDGDVLEVASLDASNGSVLVELASPLSSSVEGDEYQFTLSQCSVASTAALDVIIAEGDSAGVSTIASNSNDNSARGASAGEAVDTQEANASTGLSGGLIVGIVIGIVALLGFVGECWFHKRRQAPPAATDNGATSRSYGQTAV